MWVWGARVGKWESGVDGDVASGRRNRVGSVKGGRRNRMREWVCGEQMQKLSGERIHERLGVLRSWQQRGGEWYQCRNVTKIIWGGELSEIKESAEKGRGEGVAKGNRQTDRQFHLLA